MNYLLDTAAWINSVKEPETLSRRVRSILEAVENNRFALADISLLEASFLHRKRRLDFAMPFRQWLSRALAENLDVLPITADIAGHENVLPRAFQGDPADRLIVATAKAHGLILITPDPKIRDARLCQVEYYRFKPSRVGS